MHYLSRQLERVRSALLGGHTPGRHSRTDAGPIAPVARLSPDVRGARLVTAPIPQAQPEPRAQWFPPADWEDTGAVVRPYVLDSHGEEWRK
jgi:hypothetical protein